MKARKPVRNDAVAACVRSCVATVALCLGALNVGAGVNIDSNTQLTEDTDYRGQGAVTIAANATLDLNGHKLFVDGLAGTGTITDSTDLNADLITDGSFEMSRIPSSYQWGHIGQAARPAESDTWRSDANYGGFTKSNSSYATTVNGTFSALINTKGSLYQTVTVQESGDYVLTYLYKNRVNKDVAHEMVVVVDGSTLPDSRTVASSSAEWSDNALVLHLAAGTHTIKFLGNGAASDTATVLDDVSLRKLPAELHVVAPEGQTAEVAAVKLEGAFKFVSEGAGTCLLKADCDWTGLNVSIDTTLDLCGRTLRVNELKGTGTVTDSTALGDELIEDGTFEMSRIANGNPWGLIGHSSRPAESDTWQSDADYGGFTKANSTYAGDVKGSISAVVYTKGNLFQSVTVPEAGDYALTYLYKNRANKSGSTHEMTVELDGSALSCSRTVASSDAEWSDNMLVLHLAAGAHTVKFVGNGASDTATVLDDVSLRKIPAAGELHVVVPNGQTVEVTSVKLEGALKLVKEGAGTYLVSYQSGDGAKNCYLGGTSVREGCFKVHQPADEASQSVYNFYQTRQLGAKGSETTVEKGASFDCGGNYDGYCYTIVLNGGTYGNMGTFESVRGTGTPLRLRLTADSFATASSANMQLGETDLGGYTLDVTTPANRSLFPCGAIRNGTIISRGGRFYPRAIDCSTADLVLVGSMSCNDGTIPFHDLRVTSQSAIGHGNNYYTVSGTYTPVSDQIHRFKLLDGSTIDLSGRTTALPNPNSNGLFFEENATVYINLGARKVKSSEPIITWSAKPANVKFRALPGTAGGFVAKDNGLYWRVGFGIIVR